MAATGRRCKRCPGGPSPSPPAGGRVPVSKKVFLLFPRTPEAGRSYHNIDNNNSININIYNYCNSNGKILQDF